MDVEALLRDRNVDFKRAGEHEHVGKGWLGTDCPWCSPGWQHYRLGWNIRTGGLSCWACGKVPKLKTVAAVLNLSEGKAYALLKGVRGDWRPEKDAPDGRGKLVLPPDVGPLASAHEKYLRGRGFDPAVIAALWGVQGVGRAGGRYAWRLFIPVVSGGKTVSWTTRSISDKHDQRYLAAGPEQEVLNHRHLLYGEDLCGHTVVLVEGPTDAWRVGPGACATFGTGLSARQIRRMARFACRVVLFDSDGPGRKRAAELADMLAPLPGATFNVRLESGKDPGSADEDELCALRKRFLDRPKGTT